MYSNAWYCIYIVTTFTHAGSVSGVGDNVNCIEDVRIQCILIYGILCIFQHPTRTQAGSAGSVMTYNALVGVLQRHVDSRLESLMGVIDAQVCVCERESVCVGV